MLKISIFMFSTLKHIQFSEITLAFHPTSHIQHSNSSKIACVLGRLLLNPFARILVFLLFLVYLALSVAYSLGKCF